MKRPHTGSSAVYKYRTVFEWRLCCNCSQEFRRENGWCFLSGPFYGRQGVCRYICEDCAPTKEDASRIIDEQPWVLPAPKCKPPKLLPQLNMCGQDGEFNIS